MQPIAIRLGASLTSGCAEQSGDLLRLAFGYGTTENNGNILTQDISRDAAGFSSSQTYTYDGLNRLRSITEGSGAQTYVYDRYGNRAVRSDSYIPIAAQTPVVSSDTEAAVTAIFPSNRWSGGSYDNAGNQTARYGGTFVYDAENRVTSSTVGSVTTTYAYDGEGRRVKKDAVVMVYDAFGKLAAEYGGTATGAGRQYFTTDHLGSTRLVTNSTGGDPKCSDYLPFGEELGQGINSRGTCYATFTDPRQKFTGKERDNETGLDYFIARYYSGAQGRFTSPDPKLFPGRTDDPQSWNKYGYVRNNPLRLVDPDGHDWIESLQKYFNELIRPLLEARSNDFQVTEPPERGLGPIPSGHELVKAHAEGTARGMEFVADTMMLADVSGMGSAARSALKGDAKGTLLAVAPLAMPQIRVIGHHPEYTQLAAQMGAKYFNVPVKIWNVMSKEAQWAANQKFLDRAIKQGATFALATGRDQIRKGSALQREVEYLLKNGYEWSKDGSQLVRSAH